LGWHGSCYACRRVTRRVQGDQACQARVLLRKERANPAGEHPPRSGGGARLDGRRKGRGVRSVVLVVVGRTDRCGVRPGSRGVDWHVVCRTSKKRARCGRPKVRPPPGLLWGPGFAPPPACSAPLCPPLVWWGGCGRLGFRSGRGDRGHLPGDRPEGGGGGGSTQRGCTGVQCGARTTWQSPNVGLGQRGRGTTPQLAPTNPRSPVSAHQPKVPS
jgi:hypothetical protein